MKTAIAALTIVLLVHGVVLPCTCTNTSRLSVAQQKKFIDAASAILYGEVVSIGEPRTIIYNAGQKNESSFRRHPLRFKVMRTWKGVTESEITIEADLESSCSLNAGVGEKLMLFPRRTAKSGQLYADLCSRNLLEKEGVVRELGPGTEFRNPTPSPSPASNEEPGFFAWLWAKIASPFS